MRDEMIFFMDYVPSSREDGYGDPEMDTEKYGPVYAEMKSVGQSEFYQAQTAGKKPEIKFVITDYMDYQGQKYLIHDGIRYSILRTYRVKGSSELEITCYGGVRDAVAAVSNKDN